MSEPGTLLLAADAVLASHLCVVAFIVLGLACIGLGGLLHWSWVRNPWFRGVHLAAIGIVTVQAWLGVICPLTTLEMALRSRAGETVYAGSFISHWMRSLLYYDAPWWLFAIAYSAFAALVVASWWWVTPRRFDGGSKPRR